MRMISVETMKSYALADRARVEANEEKIQYVLMYLAGYVSANRQGR